MLTVSHMLNYERPFYIST